MSSTPTPDPAVAVAAAEATEGAIPSPDPPPPPAQELEAVPGHSHGGITPLRERPSEDPQVEADAKPKALSGWLWKKAGGGKDSGSMFSLTGRNWKRRWFTLQDGVFRYFEEPMGSGFSGFVPGKGKALWVGDLREAGKGEDGKLKASSGYDSNRQRAVLSVSFGDRLLTLGTAPGEQNPADMGVLAAWEAALEEHHRWCGDE